jgi:Flp pilus assembly protein TadG
MKVQKFARLIHRSTRSGQIAVLTGLSIVFFLALSGLAIDVSELWNTRREMQTAADAAAIAAVNDLAVQNSSDVTTDAKNASAKNGFTDGGTTSFSANPVTVAVQTPPTSGNFKSKAGAVTVTISQTQPTQFLQFVGFHTIPVSVSATGLTTTGGACIYSLDPSGASAFDITGSSSLTSACGAYVDSSSGSAATASGGGTLTAPLLGMVGGTTIHGGASVPVTTSIPAFGDPLAYVGAPSVGSSPVIRVQALVVHRRP